MKAHYVRVSTVGQNTDRQTEQTPEGYESFIEDGVSGSVPFMDRPKAAALLRKIEAGQVDEVLVHSIDRLGRNTLDVLQTIQTLTKKGVNLVSKKEGLHTIIDGKPNPTAKLIIGILASVAEMEREMIKERQLEGIAIAKRQGKYKGRPEGTKETPAQFLKKHRKVVKYLNEGRSLRDTARSAGVSVGTVKKVKDLM